MIVLGYKPPTLRDFKLIIGGGDVNEALIIKYTFSFLNSKDENNFIEYFQNKEIAYLYTQLTNLTVVLKSVFLCLSDEESAHGKLFFFSNNIVYKHIICRTSNKHRSRLSLVIDTILLFIKRSCDWYLLVITFCSI